MYIPYYPHINKRLSAEIDELIAQLEAESHADPGQDSSIRERAIRLVYLARQHDRIQQHYCNDTLPNWKRLRTERREKRIEIEITHIAATFSATPIFQGDPRGATVKLALASGHTNDWGKTGYCVPTF
jgi:hypothetical protein